MKVFPKPPRRSPFTRKPLRLPGQSVQREMERLVEDQLLPTIVFTAALGTVAFNDWLVTLQIYRPYPYVTTPLALLAGGYAVYKYFDGKRTLERLRLARDGERIVGQFLETLRAQHAKVFHDLVGDGFNLDHVVVSARGIYVIETKTFTKPGRGDAIVQYDGKQLSIRGRALARNPVRQIQAAARWLGEHLEESTGRRFPIRPVVLLPGWFVEAQGKTPHDVWVLNPKALGAFIEREPVVLKSEDVALVASRITRDLQKQ